MLTFFKKTVGDLKQRLEEMGETEEAIEEE